MSVPAQLVTVLQPDWAHLAARPTGLLVPGELHTAAGSADASCSPRSCSCSCPASFSCSRLSTPSLRSALHSAHFAPRTSHHLTSRARAALGPRRHETDARRRRERETKINEKRRRSTKREGDQRRETATHGEREHVTSGHGRGAHTSVSRRRSAGVTI